MTEAINDLNRDKSGKLLNIDQFLEDNRLKNYYKKYTWNDDDIHTGFQDIFHLEKSFGEAGREGRIDLSHLLSLAKWGDHKNSSQIKIKSGEYIPLYLYNNGVVSNKVLYDPSFFIFDLETRIDYFGPIYISKLLRFSLPGYYGAIDSRLISVCGKEGKGGEGRNWINLRVSEGSIVKPPGWGFEYAAWVFILRYIASRLNQENIKCPHPQKFVEEGLRNGGKWYCADVEMALSAYTQEVL